MATVAEAKAILTAEDRASHVLAMVSRNFDKLSRAADRMEHVNKGMQRLDRSSSLIANAGRRVQVFTGALAAGLVTHGAAEAVNRFASIERRMTRIGNTANVSREVMRSVSDEARKLSQDVATPFDDIVEGYESLAAQGRNVNEMRAMMPSIALAAQASGAAVRDIAESAGAVGEQMDIASDKMGNAFDIMVEGGNAGKFELKDMAQYLPSLAPAAAAVGLKGEAGLKKLVAMLQVVRSQTGSAGEAATSMTNVFTKMESEETAKKFGKFGIDLRKEMTKARKSGRDLLEVFIELSQKALKGDLSKIPQLFSDQEMQRGMRALLSSGQMYDDVMRSLANSQGAVARGAAQALGDTQAKLDQFANSWDTLKTKLGERIAPGLGVVIDELNKALEAGEALEKRLDKTRDRLKEIDERRDKEAGKGGQEATAPKQVSYEPIGQGRMSTLARWEKDFKAGKPMTAEQLRYLALNSNEQAIKAKVVQQYDERRGQDAAATFDKESAKQSGAMADIGSDLVAEQILQPNSRSAKSYARPGERYVIRSQEMERLHRARMGAEFDEIRRQGLEEDRYRQFDNGELARRAQQGAYTPGGLGGLPKVAPLPPPRPDAAPPQQVEASVDVNNKVTIQPTPYFWSEVDSRIDKKVGPVNAGDGNAGSSLGTSQP